MYLIYICCLSAGFVVFLLTPGMKTLYRIFLGSAAFLLIAAIVTVLMRSGMP